MHHQVEVPRQTQTQVTRTHTTLNVSDAEVARRLDAADGVIDGKMGDAEIHVKQGLASSQRTHTSSHYVQAFFIVFFSFSVELVEILEFWF